MLKKRLIAVLILAEGRVVQSVRFRHTNVIHYDAQHAVEAFNKWDVDEFVLLNVSRSSETRDQFTDVLNNVSRHCFAPLTAGGWVTDFEYARRLVSGGADKLVVNTVVEDNPGLVTRIARHFGRQCVVVSMDVRATPGGNKEVVVDRAGRGTGKDPADWARYAVSLGAGELLVNSIDHDGARQGYDLDTIRAVSEAVDVPVIAFGGVFTWQHLAEGIEAGADAVAAANIFHYTEHSTRKAKTFLHKKGFPVRQDGVLTSERRGGLSSVHPGART